MSENLKESFITDFKLSNKIEENKESENTKNLKSAKISLLICNFFFALNNLSIKLFNKYRNNYNYNLFSTMRFLAVFLLSFYIINKNKKFKFIPISLMQSPKWFLVRIFSNYIALWSITYSLFYIRLSTCVSICMTFPLFLNILSIFFFKEKFSFKYFIGCLLCLLGCFLFAISENEKKNFGEENLTNGFQLPVLLGVFYALVNGFVTSIVILSSKFMLKEMDSQNLNLYVGLYLFVFSFIIGLFDYESFFADMKDIYFLFFGLLNGCFINGAFYFLNRGSELADLSKVSYINYTQIIFSLIFGIFLLGETLGLIDLFGLFLIGGTNVYLTLFAEK